jgi:hypothetical protein
MHGYTVTFKFNTKQSIHIRARFRMQGYTVTFKFGSASAVYYSFRRHSNDKRSYDTTHPVAMG